MHAGWLAWKLKRMPGPQQTKCVKIESHVRERAMKLAKILARDFNELPIWEDINWKEKFYSRRETITSIVK